MAEFSSVLSAFIASPPAASEAARQVMRLSLLDWFAVGHLGRDEPVSRITRDFACKDGGVQSASVFGTTMRLPVRAAALVNGATSHALDYDDTHFAHIGHASVAVVPAAIGLAQDLNVDGAAFQNACLLGVEASVRVGVWLGRGHYQIGFHQTATAGTFGAAAAAAHVLRQTEAQVAQTLGLAATRAAGLKAQFGTMGKPYNAGIAAQSGVEAALLVSNGFESNPEALDGPEGFGAIHHGRADMSALDGLGKDWLFETVSHKFHACCHGLHAALEAFAMLDPDPSAITRIHVRTHPRWMTVCNQPAPMTGLGAKFSYGTVLAMAASGYDTARLDTYTDALCADPEIQALREKVEVVADDSLTETQSKVEVTQGGSVLVADFDLDAPLALDLREAKIRAKSASLLGQKQADNLWKAIEMDASADRLWGCLV